MNIAPYQHCVCRTYCNTLDLCDGETCFAEQGKKVKLVPRAGEEVVAVVLDGCVFTDNRPKCDGLFLWAGGNRKAAILVELKGAGALPHAFEQLAYVKKNRPEYRQLLDSLNRLPGSRAVEKAFIVSNGMLSKPKKETLENRFGIRVAEVLHCEAATPVPDLRRYL